MISEWNFTKKIKKCLAKKEKEIKQSQVNQKQKTSYQNPKIKNFYNCGETNKNSFTLV